MGLVGLAFLGVVLGAAGTEFLRVKRPEIIEKVEDAARRFVDSVCPSKSDDARTCATRTENAGKGEKTQQK